MAVKFKKGSKEAKAHMAKIRAMRGAGAGKHTDTKSHNVNIKVVSGTKTKSTTRQTGTSNIEKDFAKKAKAPGKRKGASGKTYYERRANRSDKPGSLLGIMTDNVKRLSDAIKLKNHLVDELKTRMTQPIRTRDKQDMIMIRALRQLIINETKIISELKKSIK